MGAIEIGAVLIALCCALVGAAFVAFQPSAHHDRGAERWARVSGLQLTPLNRALVASYVGRTRRFRLVGGFSGLFFPLLSIFTGGPLPKPFDFGLFDALLGYLLGAVIAEVSFRRPRGELPSASLVPRSVTDYLARWYRIALGLGAGVGVVAAIWYETIPGRETSGPGAPPSLIVLLVMILGTWLTVELLQRYIVARPQPAVNVDLLRADDAIRSASIHALAGAGLALELIVASVVLGEIAATYENGVTTWSLGVAAVVLFGCGLGSWVHLTRPFRRRELHPSTGDVPAR